MFDSKVVDKLFMFLSNEEYSKIHDGCVYILYMLLIEGNNSKYEVHITPSPTLQKLSPFLNLRKNESSTLSQSTVVNLLMMLKGSNEIDIVKNILGILSQICSTEGFFFFF